MTTVTERRSLAREIRKAVNTYLAWDDPNLRDEPGSLGHRNDALITARRRLDELMALHNEEVKERLGVAAKARARVRSLDKEEGAA